MSMAPPVRIPLTFDMNPRGPGSYNSYRINVMDESQEGTTYTLKRPAVLLTETLAAGLGQGLINFSGQNWAVISDNLRTSASLLNGTDGSTWAALSTGQFPGRSQAATAYFNGRWYIIGGENASIILSDIWSTADGLNWRCDLVSAPWGERTEGRCTVFQGKMWFMGGRNNATPSPRQNDVWSSPDGINWTLETGAAAWIGRTGFALMVFGNSLFVCGGRGQFLDFDDVWSSPDGKAWTRVATGTWGQRQRMGYAVFQNKMFLAGGTIGAGLGVAQNDCYSSSDGGVTWVLESGAAFASARSEFSILVYNNKMWMFAGRNRAAGTFFNTVYTTSSGTGAWTLVGSPISINSAYCAAVIPSPYSTGSTNSFSLALTAGFDGFFYLSQGRIATLNISINTNTALNPTTPNLQYQMTSFQQSQAMLIKNPTNMWVMSSGGVTKVQDSSYPTETVPGVVTLGGFVYVMDPTGLIHGSALDDPTAWPSLNVLGADFDDDQGVALSRYLNYVVAFGTYSTQLFFDAGLSPGIALQPYLNANMKIGCAAASTVASFQNTLVWVSQTREGERKVMVMNGITPTPISNVYVEKYLDSIANIQGVLVSVGGHQFYILNVNHPFSSLVYDFSSKKWVWWLTEVNASGNFLFVVNDGNALLTENTGQIYRLDPTSNDDTGPFPINVTIVTPPIDGGTMRIKDWGRLDLVCEQSGAAGIIQVSYSDDWGQNFGFARPLDCSRSRPALFRNGSSRRRMFQLNKIDFGTIMRIEALEQQIGVQPV